ncbi:cTAGE family member 5 [Limanda limanda]|uniref:cTAGE family member 5 n=1 Tax=Limanda limanda TaxID=27771 RepID=UPI0029C8E424|nr:cTAGE family member 5 [Limanda limanda]
MAVSQLCSFLWITGIVLVSVLHMSLGLLSDYKICGDSECESLISRVQAIRDHRAKDCRFLSFRRGDTISVYHKLSGQREDLWAGSIDKQFGYFPKDAVQVEQVYAANEKVVETQRSDFFCMDESGYPIDTSDLDSDDETDNQKIQIHELETHNNVTNVESPSTSADPSTEFPVSTQQSEDTSTEGNENKNAGDAAAGTHKEAHDNPAAPNEQGGSPSSSWLGSSVTGWLGLGKEEESINLPEEEEDEGKELQAETSTSSVTGWLGFGGEGKTDDAVKHGEDETKETADSYTSAFTGWLGFGGEAKTDSDEKEQDDIREVKEENEPKVTFRSRRMSLDLEGSQLHEEEKTEVQTLDWLGNGISSTLGFGVTNQESEHERNAEKEAETAIEEEEEQPSSGSWFGIGDILGFGKNKNKVDERQDSGFKDTEENKTTEEETLLEYVDASETQGEEGQKEPDEERLEEKLETETITEEGDNSVDSSSNKDTVLKSEPEAVSSTSSLDEDESKKSEINLGPELSSVDFNSDSTAQPVGEAEEVEKDKQKRETTDRGGEEESDESKEGEKQEKMGVKPSVNRDGLKEVGEIQVEELKQGKQQEETLGDAEELKEEEKQQGVKEIQEEGKQEEMEELHKVEEINGEERKKLIEVMKEKDKQWIEELKDDNKREEVEEAKEENKQEGEKRLKEEEELKDEEKGEEEGVKEVKKQAGVEGLKEEEELKDEEKIEEEEEVKEEKKQEGVEGLKEEEELNEEDKRQEEVEEFRDEDKREAKSEELKEEEKREEEMNKLKDEEKRDEEVDELKDEEKREEELDELKEEEKREEVEELKDEETREEESEELKEEKKREEESDRLKEEEKREEVEDELKDEKNREEESDELKEEDKSEEESEELKEDDKREEVEQLKDEEKREEEVEELKDEEKREDESEELKVKKNREEESEELKEEEKSEEESEELKEDEKREEVEEFKDEKKREEESEELKEEEKREEEVELKDEEKREEESEELKDKIKQQEVEEPQEEGKQEGIEELKVKKRQEEIDEERLMEEEENQEKAELEGKKKQEEVEGSKEVEKKHEGEEANEEKKQDIVEEIQKEVKREEPKEVKEESKLTEEGKQEELKEAEEINGEEKNREIDEIKERDKQEEVEMLKQEEEEKQKEGEELKEEVGELKEEETREEVEEEKEEKKQKEDAKEEKSEVELEEFNEERKPEEEEAEEEKREFEEMQQVNDVEGDRRDEEEEEGLTCLNELCPQATDDESVTDRGENISEDGVSSADGGKIQRGNENSHIGEIQTKASEETKRDVKGQEEDGLDVYETQDIDLPHLGENREDGQLYPVDPKNTDFYHGNDSDSETSTDGISNEGKPKQIESNPDHETDDVANESSDSQINESVESQISEQTVPPVSEEPAGSSLPPEDLNTRAAGTGNGGAFGLFKNAFSYLSQTRDTETEDGVDSGLETNTGEMSQPQAEIYEQEVNSNTDSNQIYKQDLPGTMATEQPQPPPSSASIQTSPMSHPHSPSLHTHFLSKHYTNLPAYMTLEEVNVLTELFGRHKLQFLDYMLGSSETVPAEPDESILSDIERLLHHHRETLMSPSMGVADAPQEDKEKTRTLIALQKLETLITRVRETSSTGKSESSKGKHQAEASCVGASCSTHSKDHKMSPVDDSRKTEDTSVAADNNIQIDDMTDVGNDGKERDEKREKNNDGCGEECSQNQLGSLQSQEGVMEQILDFVHQIGEESAVHVHTVRERLTGIAQVVSSLPDDIRPGPDLYGVPWEPVIVSSLVGLVTVLLFTCRCYSSVKSRMYRSKEHRMAAQVTQLLDEKCKVLETLSKCQQEYDEVEDSLRDSGVLAQTQKTEHLEMKAGQLENDKKELERDLDHLKDQLDQQKQHRKEQERRIAALEESMATFEEESKDLQSQEEQAQTTLKIYSMNSEKLQRNMETVGEENTLLQESNAQLRQQVEGWAERVNELEAEMQRCEVTFSGMQQDVVNKDERIMSLTDCLLKMKAWDSDLEEAEGAEKETSNGAQGKEKENGRGGITDPQGHLQKVQKLIYAAKLNADLKSVDEDKDRVFAKLNNEVQAKEDLQVSIKELENEKLSLHSDAEHYSDQVQRLQQKLQIMTEMYQENELKLHRLLTVEEKERLQKEEKLNKADKNIALAMEELNNYRQRAEEMEEELDKSKQAYNTQISAHEKKAHNNWLAARAAERDLTDIRRENALMRQKLTDTQFKLDALDKDPYALDSLARPMPFRAERSPYGPSPLGRPASETRAFLSPPTLMDGPSPRLSPRIGRGHMEPSGGHGDMERSGGPHSDSGSISPTWDRDRRGPPPGPHGPPGPLGPPGYMFSEPGGPMYRRPPPGPPPPHHRGFPPAGPPGPPRPTDMPDGLYRDNSLGPGEQEYRESGPGDRRTPPDADLRMGGPPPPGAPMGPMDGPFPRRGPYGPPPPDFYPPRGPGGPSMMPRWAPPPQGMMFPPRFPTGGPPHGPAPHPHYAPPMRPLPPDGFHPPSMGPPPPQQSLPSPPHSQSPEEHRTSPEDAI